MGEPIDIDNIEKKLIENNIPADLIENFDALYKMQEEAQRRTQLAKEKKREENIKFTEKVIASLSEKSPKKLMLHLKRSLKIMPGETLQTKI